MLLPLLTVFDGEFPCNLFFAYHNHGFVQANCGVSIQLGTKTVKVGCVGANFAKSASDGVSHWANLLLKRTLIAKGA